MNDFKTVILFPDPLISLLLGLIKNVGALVMIFSGSYMPNDHENASFLAYLSLFI